MLAPAPIGRLLALALVLVVAATAGARLLGASGGAARAQPPPPVPAAPAAPRVELCAPAAPAREAVAPAPARRITVRVTTKSRSALAFELLVADEVVHAGRTRHDGSADVELELRACPTALHARVVEPGYQQRPFSVRRAQADDAYFVALDTQAGATARGRIVDASGARVEASVTLRHWIERDGRPALGQLEAATRDVGRGRFELDYALADVHHGARLALVADGGAAGTGVLGDLALALDAPPQELEVVVGGPGVVRGRVVDASGVPAAGLGLLVRLAELDGDGGELGASDLQVARLVRCAGRGFDMDPRAALRRLAAQREADGGGHVAVELWTASDGTFEVRGLRDADHVVRAQDGRSRYPHPLTSDPVAADGAALALVYSRTHLVVRLLEADGEPRSRVEAGPRGLRETMLTYGAERAWPSEPTVIVSRCDPLSDGWTAGEEPVLDSRSISLDQIVYELDEPGRYVVGAVGGGFRGHFTTLDVRPDRRNEVTLRAAPPVEHGKLRVRVFHGGEELDRDLSVHLEDVRSAAVLLEHVAFGARSPFTFVAPPGLYRVAAQDEHGTGYHGGMYRDRTLGRAERNVEIVSGATVDVELEIERGARLAVTLEGEPAPVEAASEGDELEPVDGELLARCATLRLVTPGRRPRTVRYVEDGELTPLFELGTSVATTVVPAGRYELVGRLRDGREARASVHLVAGETLPVTLRFAR